MRASALALGLGLFMLAAPALPAEPSTTTRAISLFNEGRRLLKEGRFELACERFEQSRQVEPTIGAVLNIADCHERSGHLIAARAACMEAYSLAAAKDDTERATFAETRARELADRTPRLTITFAEVESPRPRVSVDGKPTDETSLLVDPGPHTVLAEASARKSYRQEVNLAPGARTLTVIIPKLATTIDLAEPPKPPPPARSSVGYILAGAGAALLVGGAVTGGLAFSSWGDATSACPDRYCATDAARTRGDNAASQAKTFALTSTLLFAAGGLLIAGGLYKLFASPPSASQP